MSHMIIKSIHPLRAAKIAGVIGVAIGCAIALFFFLLIIISVVMTGGYGAWPVIKAIVQLLVIPLTYGLVGFIGGGLLSIAYNITAKKIGGLKITTD